MRFADQVKGMVLQECFASASGQSPHFLAGFVSGVFPISDPDSSPPFVKKTDVLFVFSSRYASKLTLRTSTFMVNLMPFSA
jgi:hypothetical protein